MIEIFQLVCCGMYFLIKLDNEPASRIVAKLPIVCIDNFMVFWVDLLVPSYHNDKDRCFVTFIYLIATKLVLILSVCGDVDLIVASRHRTLAERATVKAR